VPFSQLVRKLSEVEGIAPTPPFALPFERASFDEGVELEAASAASGAGLSEAGSLASQSSFSASTAARRARLSQLASFDSASLGSCSSAVAVATALTGGAAGDHSSANAMTNSGSFTSKDSYPYESFDDAYFNASTASAAAASGRAALIAPAGVSNTVDVVVTTAEPDLTQSLPSCR